MDQAKNRAVKNPAEKSVPIKQVLRVFYKNTILSVPISIIALVKALS